VTTGPKLRERERERVKAKEESGRMAGFVNKTTMKIEN
jgi:hypothetical protein